MSGIAVAFFWFVMAAVHLVVDPAGFDISLLPRLVILLGFLVSILLSMLVALTCVPSLSGGASRGAAGLWHGTPPTFEPVVCWWAAYTACVWMSLAWAFNPSAGLGDCFKSTAAWAVLWLTCVLLPRLPRWQERLPFMAGCGLLAVVGTCIFEIITARAALPAGIIPDRRFMEAHVTGNQSNVNLCANLLVMLLPWCLCGLATGNGARRWFAAVVAAAGVAMIGLAQSRSAFVGLAAAAAVALIAMLAMPRPLGLSEAGRRWLLAAVAAVGGVLTGFLVLAPDDVAVARRLRSIVVDPPAAPGTPFRDGGRREIWRLTGRMIADRPLTGVGAGNFGIVSQAYYDERLDLSRMHHNWPHPHNDFLWVFSEKGLFGIVSFVGVLCAAMLAACRVLRRTSDRRDAWIAVGMLAVLTAYATTACFDFPLERVSQPVVLAVTCGVVAVLARQTRTCHDGSTAGAMAERAAARSLSPARMVSPLWAGRARLAVLLAVTPVLAVGTVWAGAATVQDRRIRGIYRDLKGGRWEEMLDLTRRAQMPWRTIDTYLTPLAYLEGYALQKLGRADEAIEAVERSLDHNPNRLATLTTLGILYLQAGRLGQAETCFREVVRRYPQNPPGYVNLAACLIEAGRPDEAQELLEAIPEDMRTAAISRTLEQARAAVAADASPEPARPASGQE